MSLEDISNSNKENQLRVIDMDAVRELRFLKKYAEADAMIAAHNEQMEKARLQDKREQRRRENLLRKKGKFKVGICSVCGVQTHNGVFCPLHRPELKTSAAEHNRQRTAARTISKITQRIKDKLL